MLAKINLDGKEHVAIVFNEYVDFAQIQEFKNAINSCMSVASHNSDLYQSLEKYHLHYLMEEMELSIDQIYEMFHFYFGKSNIQRDAKKSQKKLCEIYL